MAFQGQNLPLGFAVLLPSKVIDYIHSEKTIAKRKTPNPEGSSLRPCDPSISFLPNFNFSSRTQVSEGV